MFSIKELKKPFFLIISIFLGSTLFSQAHAFEGCISTCEATGPLTIPPVIFPPFPEGTSSDTHYWTNDIPDEGLPLGTHTVICRLIKRSDGSVAHTDESIIEIVDTTPPFFNEGTQYNEVTAVDYFTTLTPEIIGFTPSAIDAVDPDVQITLLGFLDDSTNKFSLKFTTGYYHNVWWQAVDKEGNESLITHLVTIVPEANLKESPTAVIGGNAYVTVELNGNAIDRYRDAVKPGHAARGPSSSVIIEVELTGTAIDKIHESEEARIPKSAKDSDYNFESLEFEIYPNGTTATETFLLPSGVGITSSDTLIATIVDSEGYVSVDSATPINISLTDQNIAPRIHLQSYLEDPCFDRPAPSGKSERCSPSRFEGTTFPWNSSDYVIVQATIIDEDDTTHVWDVNSVPNTKSPDNTKISFIPLDSPANIVTVTVTATDSGGLVSSETLEIILAQDSAPSLSGTDTDGDGTSDRDEGLGDADADGIPDYLDNNPNVSQLPLSGPSGQASDPMFVDPGMTLTLGNTKRTADGFSADDATISSDDLAEHGNDGQGASDTVDREYPVENRITAMIDFEVRGLNKGETVTVVIPLPEGASIPNYAQYRKYTADQRWNDFVVNAKNAISSAPRNSNNTCPAFGSDYTSGLTVGHQCIALSIEDGGPNDADNIVNGIIVDPGVLAIGNLVPTAVASATIPRVDEGKWGQLNGSASSDPENAPLTYTWTQTEGPAVIELETGNKYSFIAPQVEQDTTVTFTLSVNDGVNTSNTVSVSFIVKDTSQATDSNGNTDSNTTTTTTTTSGSKAASSHLLILLLLPLALFRNRKTRKIQ